MGLEWFKLYSHGILRGSIVAQMTLEEQMVWVKLLCFASECRDRGIIRRAKGIPFEREDLARLLGIPEFLLSSTIEKCIKDENADDPLTRIMILPDGSLQIANWERYQRKRTSRNSNQPQDDTPVSEEDKQAAQQAAAAKLAFLQPEAAKRGIDIRETDDRFKARPGTEEVEKEG